MTTIAEITTILPAPFKRFDTDIIMAKIMSEHGAFFAFSEQQFKEKKQFGIEYVDVFFGMLAPKSEAQAIIDKLQLLSKERKEWTLANNTKESIIWYELANHECQIVGSYNEIIGLLSEYDIIEEEIKAEWPKYWDNCVANDYF